MKLTAESPTRIGGRRPTCSNPEGAFRFPVLQPGTFRVKAEAPRLQTVVQDHIRVGLNAAAELNVIIEVASAQVEEVRVVEKAPLVSASTANVKEVFDVDFRSRNYFSGLIWESLLTDNLIFRSRRRQLLKLPRTPPMVRGGT